MEPDPTPTPPRASPRVRRPSFVVMSVTGALLAAPMAVAAAAVPALAAPSAVAGLVTTTDDDAEPFDATSAHDVTGELDQDDDGAINATNRSTGDQERISAPGTIDVPPPGGLSVPAAR